MKYCGAITLLQYFNLENSRCMVINYGTHAFNHSRPNHNINDQNNNYYG